MSCKTENKIFEVGGEDKEITCTQYPAFDALKFKLRVVKVLGPAVSKLLPVIQSDDEDQLGAISSAIASLFDSASPDEVVELMSDMLTTGNIRYDGKPMNSSMITTEFSGDDLMVIYKILIFVLKVNYSAFFKGQKAEAFLTKVQKSV